MWFKKKQLEPTLEEKLIDARARLARYEQLEDSDFTIYPTNSPFIQRGVDPKPLMIARAKDDIAELEIIIGQNALMAEGRDRW